MEECKLRRVKEQRLLVSGRQLSSAVLRVRREEEVVVNDAAGAWKAVPIAAIAAVTAA